MAWIKQSWPLRVINKMATIFSSQQQTEDEAISIDIKAMTEIIAEDGLSSPLCCIYRVPPKIRRLKEEGYTPKVVSTGPFHHGDVRLREMERHKEIMFKRFAHGKDLDSLVNLAKQRESMVRASYSESINYNKKDFMKLILVDSAFVIQLFMMSYSGLMNLDAKLSQRRLLADIHEDLLLLENQLPFFFLKELFDKAFPEYPRSFLQLTYLYFSHHNMQNSEPNDEIKHFTDLLRLFHLPRTQLPMECFAGDGANMLMYSANELQESGVKLKGSKTECLLDLKFSGSVLQIPQIQVEDKTETFFRNVIALEQCYYPYKSYFTDYIIVLDRLVNTNKDAEVLAHKNIINNWLGDANDIATLFNSLLKHVSPSNFNVEYLGIFGRLNKFYQDRCHKRKASLRRDYCNTPWQTVASIAAIILLILTITQTVCSILQVVQK